MKVKLKHKKGNARAKSNEQNHLSSLKNPIKQYLNLVFKLDKFFQFHWEDLKIIFIDDCILIFENNKNFWWT